MSAIQKITITPVYGLSREWEHDRFDLNSLPYDITAGVRLQYVNELMASADFGSWRKQFLSQQNVDDLKKWEHALVHLFEGEEHLQSHAEAESKELVHWIFWGLQIVRPTRQPYMSLQAVLRDETKLEPFTFTHPADSLLLIPDSECLNSIRNKDCSQLITISPALLRLMELNKGPVVRAIRQMKIGYEVEYSDVQQLLWVTGLDSLYTSAERENQGRRVASERIKQFLGSDYPLYKNGELPPYVPTPEITVGEVVEDVYKLRNFFAHGDWPGEDWTGKAFRKGVGGSVVSYADMLREASSVLLRESLRKILQENLIDLFGDKKAMNAHFAELGLVRSKLRKKK